MSPQPLTVPKTQSAVMVPGTPLGKIAVDTNHGSLQTLAHIEGETLSPGGFIEGGGTMILWLWARDPGTAIFALTLRKWWKASREQNPHTQPAHLQPIHLTRVGQLRPGKDTQKAAQQAPPPEGGLDEQVKDKLMDSTTL